MKIQLRVERAAKIARIVYILCTSIVLQFFLAGTSSAQNLRSYTIATATPGGTFYRVGYAIAALVTEDLGKEIQNPGDEKNNDKKSNLPPIISMTARNTAGSVENIKLMLTKQAEFSLVQGFIGAKVTNGAYNVNPIEIENKLRAVTPVWFNVEHFIVRRDALNSVTEPGSIDDLKYLARTDNPNNKPRFSIGKPGSGTRESGLHILNAIGIKQPEEQFEFIESSYNESAEQLINKEIEGMNTPAGIPVDAVKKVFEKLGDKAIILGFNKNHLEKINRNLGLKNRNFEIWQDYIIQGNENDYKNLQSAIKTIAQPNFLAVRKDINEHDVCRITELIYSNKIFFENIHASTEALFNKEKQKKAIEKLPFKLHTGARLYYENAGKKKKPCGDPPKEENK